MRTAHKNQAAIAGKYIGEIDENHQIAAVDSAVFAIIERQLPMKTGLLAATVEWMKCLSLGIPHQCPAGKAWLVIGQLQHDGLGLLLND